MTNLSPTVLDVLHDHRDSIDRLDAILIYTLGERFRHTKTIGKLKAENNLPPSDPDRERYQISRLENLADEAGLDPKFAKNLLNFIIQEVIQHHKKHQL
jgi:chorismate mutase|tara:strand:+ start:97 stop:393 length:297 start_codon:yes stop_codon:yes gene_type:complete